MAIVHSRRTAVILSPAWLADLAQVNAFQMALTGDLASNERRVLPVLRQPCVLPLYLSHLVPLNMMDSGDLNESLERLIAAASGNPRKSSVIMDSHTDLSLPTISAVESVPLPRVGLSIRAQRLLRVIVLITVEVVLVLYLISNFLPHANSTNVPTNKPTDVPTSIPISAQSTDVLFPFFTLPNTSIHTNTVDGAAYVYIPAGTFTMGSHSGEFDEQPSHTVYLDDYWIMRTEVTNKQYGLCVAAGSCSEPSNSAWNSSTDANNPVVNVDWQQAADYAFWVGGTLPTEAQWEKACQGTESRNYPWGDGTPGIGMGTYTVTIMFSSDNSPAPKAPTFDVSFYLSESTSYRALYMVEKVGEWTADWYDNNYYSNSPILNPTGSDNSGLRVLRGLPPSLRYGYALCATRHKYNPNTQHGFFGFRVVMSDF